MSELYPTNKEIRETAVLLLAADSALCDGQKAEDALIWARNWAKSVDENPIHEGDCTNQPHTCSLCVLEEMEEKARKMWNE